MLIGFIIGFVAMSILTTVAIVGAEKDNPLLVYLFGGPVVWLLILVGGAAYRIYKKIALENFRANYGRYEFHGGPLDGEIYYIHRKISKDFYRKHESPEIYVEFLRHCADAKSRPFSSKLVTPAGHVKYSYQADLILRYADPDSPYVEKRRRRG